MLWKAEERNLGHIGGRRTLSPILTETKMFHNKHWLKIKILQHLNPEQEVSLFSFRYVAVKKIMRGFLGLCTQIHSLAVEWEWARRHGLEFGRTEHTISFRGEYQITSVIRIS